MAILRCSESFTVWQDGAPVAFVAGQLVDDKHPIVKTHRHLFAEPEAATRPAQPTTLRPVEEATAVPGEQRTLTPPPVSAGGDLFDPSQHTAPEVIDHLRNAGEDERERVLAAEKDGQARKTVLSADLNK